MGRHRCTRYGYDPQHIKESPKKNLTHTQFMLIVWWLHLLSGMGHYVIQLREIGQVLVMDNKLTNFGYNYPKQRLNWIPRTVYKMHTSDG